MDQPPIRTRSDGSVLYVVPTLGTRASFLTETLDSLQRQEGAALAVAVVAPRSAMRLREEVTRRSMHFVIQKGTGMSSAINQGWREYGSGHEFWAWLGDDDTLMPGGAHRAVRNLQESPRASMVYGCCAYVDEKGTVRFIARPTRLAGRLLRWGPNLVPQPGSVARADAVRRAGGLDEDLRYAMDLDLFLRLQDIGPIRYEPSVLATFRWHDESTTVSSGAKSEAESREVRARTWKGHRAIGRLIEPGAHLAGRALHKAQRRAPQSLHSSR